MPRHRPLVRRAPGGPTLRDGGPRPQGRRREQRGFLDTGLPRFSGKDFDGYVGSAVDITRLGRARAELSILAAMIAGARAGARTALARCCTEDVCQRMMALTLRLHSLGAAHDGEANAVVADISENWQAWLARSPR